MTRMDRLQKVTVSVGQTSVVLTCFFIPLSTSLMGFFAMLTLVCCLIPGNIREVPGAIRQHPSGLIACLLFAVLAIGLIYTPASFSEGTDTLFKYRELLYIPVVLTLLQKNGRYSVLAEKGFIAGCIILMIISYGMYFSLFPPHKYGNSILYHITHSFFMALLGFWTLQRMLHTRKLFIFWLLVFILTMINIVHINPGRTGMLLFLLLIVLSLIQWLSLKKFTAALVVVTVVFSGAFILSDNLSTRTRMALAEIKNYTPEKSRTSLGMRFDWWDNSIELIQQAPILGHGPGSFGVMQKKLIEGKKTVQSDNPHNEYLFIGVQAGVFGLSLYLVLFGFLLIAANRLPKQRKYLLQGFVLAMAIGCLVNSFLYDSHQGHFFAFLTTILLIPPPEDQQRVAKQMEYNG